MRIEIDKTSRATFLYDVFIGFSRKDMGIANEVYTALQATGINAFIDKDVAGGRDFLEEIAESIEVSKVFIFLASNNSYVANYASDEVAYAKTHIHRKCLYCYIIDGSSLPKDFELAFVAINVRTIPETPIKPNMVD